MDHYNDRNLLGLLQPILAFLYLYLHANANYAREQSSLELWRRTVAKTTKSII